MSKILFFILLLGLFFYETSDGIAGNGGFYQNFLVFKIIKRLLRLTKFSNFFISDKYLSTVFIVLFIRY